MFRKEWLYSKHNEHMIDKPEKRKASERRLYIGRAREVKLEFKPAIKADVFLSHREELLAKQCQACLLSEKLKSAKNIKLNRS